MFKCSESTCKFIELKQNKCCSLQIPTGCKSILRALRRQQAIKDIRGILPGHCPALSPGGHLLFCSRQFDLLALLLLQTTAHNYVNSFSYDFLLADYYLLSLLSYCFVYSTWSRCSCKVVCTYHVVSFLHDISFTKYKLFPKSVTYYYFKNDKGIL